MMDLGYVYVVVATISETTKTGRYNFKDIKAAFTSIVEAVKFYDKIGDINKKLYSYKIAEMLLFDEQGWGYVVPDGAREKYAKDSKKALKIYEKYNNIMREAE